jgi:hypothetical protein
MYFGAFIIMCGVGLELSPSFISKSIPGNTTGMLHDAGANASSWWWSVLFALGQVPAALCSIYQEQAFNRGVRINVVYMMAWSSLAQFISLCFAVPLNFIPGFGNAGGSISGFMGNMYNATLCVRNNLPNHSAECSSAGVLLALCVLTMLLTNVFQALLVKHSSASLSVLVLTMITPASTFCFTLPFLMGKDHTETMSITEWLALVILMIGVVIYRYADILERKEEVGSGDNSIEDDNGQDSRDRASSHPSISSSNRHSKTIASRPLLMGTRSGIINSEYTGGGKLSKEARRKRHISIFFEGTVLESKALQESHQSAPLIISQSMPSESRYGRLIKSEKKAPRPSSSVDDMYRTFV